MIRSSLQISALAEACTASPLSPNTFPQGGTGRLSACSQMATIITKWTTGASAVSSLRSSHSSLCSLEITSLIKYIKFITYLGHPIKNCWISFKSMDLLKILTFVRHASHMEFNFPKKEGTGIAKLIPHIQADI